jgi:hypothetical protein
MRVARWGGRGEGGFMAEEKYLFARKRINVRARVDFLIPNNVLSELFFSSSAREKA